MTNLKDARKDPKKMEKFIKEREKAAPGDKERLEKAISDLSKGGKSKPARGTSDPDAS